MSLSDTLESLAAPCSLPRPLIPRWVRGLCCMLAALTAAHAAALQLYVSPAGADTNPGTAARPLATPGAAQLLLRAQAASGGLPTGGATVWLAGGYYNLSSGLVFTAQDSGSAAAPIAYASMPGQQAHLTGGATLDPSWFTLVTSGSPVWSRLDPTAQGQVYQVNLPAHGITDYGTLKLRGYGLRSSAPLELFANGAPMTLARWPNAGAPLILTAAPSSGAQISYSGTRPSRWTQATDIWMHGLWSEPWADYHLPVSSIDRTAQTVTFGQPPPEFGMSAFQPYYVYNLLEELDAPGEYYLDRSSGILYFWPPASLAGSVLQISLLETPLITCTSCQYLTFQDLVLEVARGPLVTVSAGNQVRLEGCVLRNAGQYGALLQGTASGLSHCTVTGTGEEGVRLQGGDRPTLTPGNDYVSHSRINHAARLAWGFKPGIALEGGCGNSATNNQLSELPHSAINFSGNNHLVASNEIWRVGLHTGDAGAIYSAGSWAYRGNVIEYNYVHDIDTDLGSSDSKGVYLDNCISGTEVFGNIFYNVADIAIMCSGGRDTAISNNVIAISGVGHYNDDRGRALIDNLPGDGWNLLEQLTSNGIEYQQGIWASEYPACAAIPDSWALIQQGLWRNPQGCFFADNVGWANGGWTLEQNSSGTGVFSLYTSFAPNNSAQAPLFTAAQALDRSQRPATITASLAGFQALPFAAIGPDDSAEPAATQAPAAPQLTVDTVTSTSAQLEWADSGVPAAQRPTGFEVQEQTGAGSWQVVGTYGPDVDFTPLSGLAAATAYGLRVRAFNAQGSTYSNVAAITTAAAPLATGAVIHLAAQSLLTVVHDGHQNGTIQFAQGVPDANGSVQVYDSGDAVQATFTVPAAGQYRLALRARAGGGGGPTSFWPLGYALTLDGAALPITGDLTSLSALDLNYGGCFWGTMDSDAVTLAAGPHTVVITANETWGVLEALDVVTLIPPAVTVPPPTGGSAGSWTGSDVGTVAVAGSSTVSDGVYTLTGAGADIWNATVGYQYDWQTQQADGSIVARVGALQNTDPWAKAGVMITPSLDPAAPYAGVFVSSGDGIVFQWRASSGGASASLQIAAGVSAHAPSWVKLVRSGNVFTAYQSSDGLAWTAIGSATIAMDSAVLAGLAVTSHQPAAAATAVFDSVTAQFAGSGSSGTPAVIQVAATGLLQIVTDKKLNGTIGISHGTLDGEGSVRMYDPGDAVQTMFTAPSAGSYQLNLRVRSGGSTGSTGFWPGGYQLSLDGVPVALTGAPLSLSALDPAYGGCYWGTMNSASLTLAAGPHTVVITAEESWAVINYLDITPLVSAAVTWTSTDVGTTGVAGSASFAGGIYTLTGGGADIWNSTVGYHYDWQTESGNATLVARVATLQNTDPWAKAGVVMAGSLNADDAYAGVFVTPGNGVVFQWRTAAGVDCSSAQLSATLHAPYWVKLVRAGTAVTAYESPDGSAWTVIGSATIPFAAQALAGLAVTSHNNSVSAAATFDNVTVQAAGP